MKAMWIPSSILPLAAALVFAACQAARAGYGSALNTAVRPEGKFQMRDYPVLTVVETPQRSNAADRSLKP